MTYGLQPWEMEGLRRKEWSAICNDYLARQRAEREA